MSSQPALRYYRDPECKQAFDGPVDLGVADLGTEKTSTVYVKNVGDRDAHDLTAESQNPSLIVKMSKSNLAVGEAAPLQLTWDTHGAKADLSADIIWGVKFFPFRK